MPQVFPKVCLSFSSFLIAVETTHQSKEMKVNSVFGGEYQHTKCQSKTIEHTEQHMCMFFCK